MNPGELLTRLTVWLALVAYAIGAGILLCAQPGTRWLTAARWAWTIGCICFLGHVVCAFNYYHRWSHLAAYHETAQQTAEITGVTWGGGLFFNYIFTGLWAADVLWWWLRPESFGRRSARLSALWHGFMFFMVFNGTVVFGSGPVRWLGGLICATLAALWWQQRRSAQHGKSWHARG